MPETAATGTFRVSSNSIDQLLAESATALASAQHVLLTSTPGDDLAEEDFEDRVRRLLEGASSLSSLIICIPTMARLHPSNSLPKVINVLHGASKLSPKCRLGLAVHEAEQAWSALPILNRIVELKLRLDSLELMRAYFPVEALLEAAQACGLASLILNDSQVSSSTAWTGATSDESIGSSVPITSIATSTDLDTSPGLGVLISAAAPSLTHLTLTTGKSDRSLSLRETAFPQLLDLILAESLLSDATQAQMPILRSLALPSITSADTITVIQAAVGSSWSNLRSVHVGRMIASEATHALVRLKESTSLNITIGAIAIRNPKELTPAALALSERLVNAAGPIGEDWPSGFGGTEYPFLKEVNLKVHEGGNVEAFLAELNAPYLEGKTITLVGRRNGKGKNR